MSALKRFLLPHLLSMRTSIGRPARYSDVQALIRRCQPYDSGHPLIRMGGDGDGGYLLPDDLEGLQACYSPGVSSTATFEEQLAGLGVPSFMADASVEGPPNENPLFNFEKQFLGVGGDTGTLRLEDWVQTKTPDASELVLQMDIEGAEYSVLLDTPDDVLRRFRIIVVEMHNFAFLYDKMGFQLIDLTLRKLGHWFDIVHLHPNNCAALVRYKNAFVPPVLEFTFLRRDRMKARSPRADFPHPLDVTNYPVRRDVTLPPAFYGR
jgi:hypothetical protein